MNPLLLKQGFSLARDFAQRVNEYRQEKQREAYDALVAAADEFNAEFEGDDLARRGQALIDESRREAGKLTQAAHRRLDQAREQLANRAQDASKQVEKRTTNLVDKVSVKKAKRKQRRKTLGRIAAGTGIVAVLAAIAAAVYYFVFGPGKKEEPRTTPPRVEEHSGEKESTLVYSTTTTDGGEFAAGSVDDSVAGSAGPLSEEPAERDAELMDDIDSQLAEFDAEGGQQKPLAADDTYGKHTKEN
ncbi:hypothetical protein [Corynebacterium cystitidis]|uniref:Uncharacterized protein n=1 Tax=Corynebacterium cystitidis DSM 20524 TaxID=1121357 RepID=A0A1H9UM25_9CORY|nr:hypothetical protein [Corynebacterium cystitidis]WJY81013.1 hypothetical protein CCYS_00140 [Corynebacterium cystitidis DSM 20524]SES10053.1 hypothetical protein SAMN05661109_01857 [Corynebacterium cystitidis DSM 20524]SNV90687.1 Uncharacterised protein [Corynebacterium cystitidis]